MKVALLFSAAALWHGVQSAVWRPAGNVLEARQAGVCTATTTRTNIINRTVTATVTNTATTTLTRSTTRTSISTSTSVVTTTRTATTTKTSVQTQTTVATRTTTITNTQLRSTTTTLTTTTTKAVTSTSTTRLTTYTTLTATTTRTTLLSTCPAISTSTTTTLQTSSTSTQSPTASSTTGPCASGAPFTSIITVPGGPSYGQCANTLFAAADTRTIYMGSNDFNKCAAYCAADSTCVGYVVNVNNCFLRPDLGPIMSYSGINSFKLISGSGTPSSTTTIPPTTVSATTSTAISTDGPCANGAQFSGTIVVPGGPTYGICLGTLFAAANTQSIYMGSNDFNRCAAICAADTTCIGYVVSSNYCFPRPVLGPALAYANENSFKLIPNTGTPTVSTTTTTSAAATNGPCANGAQFSGTIAVPNGPSYGICLGTLFAAGNTQTIYMGSNDFNRCGVICAADATCIGYVVSGNNCYLRPELGPALAYASENSFKLIPGSFNPVSSTTVPSTTTALPTSGSSEAPCASGAQFNRIIQVPNGPSYGVCSDTLWPGADSQSISMGSNDVPKCAALCSAESRCLGATVNANTCYFKYDLGGIYPIAGIESLKLIPGTFNPASTTTTTTTTNMATTASASSSSAAPCASGAQFNRIVQVPNGPSYGVCSDTLWPGADSQSIYMGNNDVPRCAALCAAESRCLGATVNANTCFFKYDLGGIYPYAGIESLKLIPGTFNPAPTTSTTTRIMTTTTTTSQIPSTTSAGPCFSGAQFSRTIIAANSDVYGVCDATDFYAGDLQGSPSVPSSVTEPVAWCADFCSQKAGCLGVTFIYRDWICYIKGTINSPTSLNGGLAILKISSGQSAISTTSSATVSATVSTTVSMATTIISTTTTSILTTTSSSAVVCDPVVDGSFENIWGHSTATTTPIPQAQYPWKSIGGANDDVNPFNMANGDDPATAYDGDITWMFYADRPGVTALYQDLQNVGGVYQLTYAFWLEQYEGNNDQCTFMVKLDDYVVDSFDTSQSLARPWTGDSGRQYFSRRFVWETRELSGTSRLKFELTCSPSHSGGLTIMIDGIQMARIRNLDGSDTMCNRWGEA